MSNNSNINEDRELLNRLRNPSSNSKKPEAKNEQDEQKPFYSDWYASRNKTPEEEKKSHKRDRNDRQKLFAGQSGNDGNNELRTKILRIQLSPKEYGKVQNFYQKSSLNTMAGFCREKLLSEPGTIKNNNKAATNLISVASKLQQIESNLKKIGNNINQVAKVSNTNKTESLTQLYEQQLAELKNEIDEFQQIKKQMAKILSEGSL